jgi:hypothetical protein
VIKGDHRYERTDMEHDVEEEIAPFHVNT